MLTPSLRAAGYEVWCINPAGRYLDITGDAALNPYQPVIDAMHGDADARKDAVKLASDFAALHYPLVRDEKNPYFTHGSRRVIVLVILILAMLDPANCTPTPFTC